MVTEITIDDVEPIFSVVVPAFNAQEYIAATLDSLVKQQFPFFEIIVVDDGSTDGTKSVIDKFSFDRRLRYVHQDNQGTGGALNTGHAISRGKYLTWCSADNIYFPHFLATFFNVFQQLEAQKVPVEFLYGDFIYVNNAGQQIGVVQHKDAQPKKDLVNGYDLGMAFAYTRNLYLKTGPYKKMICEDYEWSVRAACHTNFGLIKQFLAAFRVHDKQITGSRKEEELAAANEAKKLAAQFIAEGKYD